MNNDNEYIPKHVNTSSKLPTKKKRRIKVKAVTLGLIFLVCLIIFILCFSNVIGWVKDSNKNNRMIDEITEDITIEEVSDTNDTELVNEEPKKESDYWYYVKQSLISVDINALKAKNSDTLGWISVNNTNVNYPFVQTSNNDYYLKHAFDKSNNSAGWIFLDYRNNKDFSDKNNILYGHARRDNSMFGSLRSVITKDWYSNKDNHIIKLSTEIENTMWQIFSVYRIETESYYLTTTFSTNLEYERFLSTIKERSLYDFDVTLSRNDKILTLSTCSGEHNRIVVHAKLIKRSSR